MTKQLLLFTFHCKNDFNSKIIKISFLLYNFVIYLWINTLFINDSILHDLFISKGKVGLFHYTYNLIIISIIVSTIKNILLLLVFTENDIVSLKENENDTYDRESVRKVLTSVALKCCLFFVFNILTLSFIWVYLACFFTIFKNTQIFVIKNTAICFAISLFIPIVLGPFISAIRIFALSNRESQNRLCAYYLSKALQIFI